MFDGVDIVYKHIVDKINYIMNTCILNYCQC